MNRQRKVPFNPSSTSRTAAAGYKQLPSSGVPQAFVEAMKRISSASDVVSNPQSKAEIAESSDVKWKSSFHPIHKRDGNCQEKSTSSSERTELYDPNSPLSSDSESEMSGAHVRKQSPAHEGESLGRQQLSSDRRRHDRRRWESSYSESGNRPLDNHEFSTSTRPAESRGLSPGHRLPEGQAYNPETESLDGPGYGFRSGPLHQRGCSPDRFIHGSSGQFPESYRGSRTNGEERITLPEYRREMTTTLRPSPPRSKRDHQQLAYVETGLNQEAPLSKVTQPRADTGMIDKCPIVCDLCDVELANAQELEDHLDCKSHWDTLEHIQQNNSYDDLAIAFLQEVMLYKSRHCSRAVEDDSLQALQENEHMTKVEMFRCAACKVYVCTSRAEVQSHMTSQEHVSNTKEFEVQQRRSCLNKAETMIKELQPQFQHFLKGGCPFE